MNTSPEGGLLSPATVPRPLSPRVLEAWADSSRSKRPAAVAHAALRTRAPSHLELLAHLSSNGRLSAGQLLDRFDPSPARRRTGLRLDHDWLPWFAVLAAETLEASAQRAAAVEALWYSWRHERYRRIGLGDRELDTYLVQSLVVHGRLDDARTFVDSPNAVPEESRSFLICDLANPFLPGSRANDLDRWLDLLNQPIARPGVERVDIAESGPTPFDRLHAVATSDVDGPLISVVMPTHRPQTELVAAVRSVLRQSWTNLELLIIDDASGTSYDPMFEHVARLDPRIRILRQAENGGAYLARNAAVAAASGDFVTFQDSDDWSHPRRLERQVAPLLKDSAIVATRSLSIRVSELVLHQLPGFATVRENASSIMFRRDQVLRQVGFFDSVRKGGDSEHSARLERALGRTTTLVPEPLAFVRLGPSSLSRDDFKFGWSRSARLAYRESFQRWHRSPKTPSSLPLAREPARRPFPAPREYLPRSRSLGPADLDVLFVADFATDAPGSGRLRDEIMTLSRHGLSVGYLHVEAGAAFPRLRPRVASPLTDLWADGHAERVSTGAAASAKVLLVAAPEILQFPPAELGELQAGSIVIRRGTDETLYDPRDCSQIAEEIWGRRPMWTSDGWAGAPDSAACDLAPFPIVIDLSYWQIRRRGPRNSRPTIGLLDLTARRASGALGSALRPRSRDLDVRLLGDRKSLTNAIGGAIPAEWLVYDRGQVDYRTFLAQIDLLICPTSRLPSTPTVHLLEAALASGARVVAPPAYHGALGNRATYAASKNEYCRVLDQIRSGPGGVEMIGVGGHRGDAYDQSVTYVRRIRELIALV